MEKQEVLKAIKEIREKPKRKFKQTFDLIINLHHLDLKKHNIDSYISLNHAPKKIKTTIFIDKTLESKAKILFDNAILKEDFPKYYLILDKIYSIYRDTYSNRIEKEKYTKTAETFMDIYISIVIAAPMILMLLLMMMKISGLGVSLSTSMITLIMVLGVSVVNVGFLTFLHLKQSNE